MRLHRLDSAETIFFLRELANIEAQSYDVKYAKLKGLQFLPVLPGLDPTDKSNIYRQFDAVGESKRMTSPTDDSPLVNVKGKEFTSIHQDYTAAFAYSVDEIRAAARVRRPLDTMRAMAARRVLNQRIDDMCATGDAAAGLKGLINQPNALTYATPNGGGGQKAWTTKTPDEILADLNGMVDTVFVGTLEVESIKRILLPTAQFRLISTRARSTVSDTTILEYFQQNNPGVEVLSWERLKGAGSTASDRAVAYAPDVMNVHLLMPIPFEQMEPERLGMGFKVTQRVKLGGVVAPYPQSICYADFI